jgi:hypothetical protein
LRVERVGIERFERLLICKQRSWVHPAWAPMCQREASAPGGLPSSLIARWGIGLLPILPMRQGGTRDT